MPDTALLLRSLTASVERLFGPDIVYASDQEAILASLKIVETRETLGAETFAAWAERLDAQLADLAERLSLQTIAPDRFVDLTALREDVAQGPSATQAERDATQKRAMQAWSDLVGELAADRRLPPAERIRIVADTALSEKQRVHELCGAMLKQSAVEDKEITRERLERYLADRFDEAALKVTSFRPLPGGYGKETTLFEVSGTALDGAFVMRRDRDIPTVDNDCHRIDREYPVIRAAHGHGFPAPEALWLDTEHRLLPGGDFLVMRKAPGTTGGDVHGASGAVGDELTELLATSVAQLHALPPLRELGTISEGIAPELWDMPTRQVTERYIRSFRDIYLAEMIAPSPAVLALYGWLLDNVPDAPDRPVLLHGDIGFHNFIIDEGRLSAVVDWEFAHIGDPADDVGYVFNTAGRSLDLGAFMAFYRAAGGPEIDEGRLRFFRIWGHLRNLTASQLTTNRFETGQLDELKLGHVGHSMMAGFLDPIMAIMAEIPSA